MPQGYRSLAGVKTHVDRITHFDISRIMKMNMPPDALVEAASAFSALGSEQRLTVLLSLVRAGPEGLSIGELGARSGISGSTLTHHTRALVNAGLVTQTKRGRSIVCAVAYDRVEGLSGFLLKHCCADADEGHAHG